MATLIKILQEHTKLQNTFFKQLYISHKKHWNTDENFFFIGIILRKFALRHQVSKHMHSTTTEEQI